MFNWFFNALSYFGWRSKKKANITLVGNDCGGKSTLLHMLRYNKLLAPEPTRHVNQGEVVIGNVSFKIADCPGHTAGRKLWHQYLTQVDAIIYVIDATDPQRFDESRGELTKLLAMENLQTTPILILANKIDSPYAVHELEIRRRFDLDRLETETRPMQLHMCSVVNRMGYQAGFKFLADCL
jgi:GTP-binding protein SAR1